MPERSGIEMFAEDQFSATFKKYDSALNKAERQAETTARTISRAGRQMQRETNAMLSSLTGRMDRLKNELEETKARGREFLATVERDEASLATGVTGAVGALGAVGAAVSAAALVVGVGVKKILDTLDPWLQRVPVLAQAQEELNAQWDATATTLAQTAAPALAEWVRLKIAALEALTPFLEGLKRLVFLLHVANIAVVEYQQSFGKWYDSILGPAQVIPALARAMGDAEGRQETWNRVMEQARDLWKDYNADLLELDETVKKTEWEPKALETATAYDKIADTISNALNRIQKMQSDHERQLQRQAEDAARDRARAWDKYGDQVAKAIKDGEKRLGKITESYEKSRAKTIASYQERVVEVEKEGQKDRIKAQQDFERQSRQARERFQLSQIQSERRYQFERQRLIAEGDTLAIEELDARYKLERKEAKENEALRERQDRENQATQIRETGEAAREQLREMEKQLGEQLAEQETNYREQIETQRLTNQERLAEMAADFAERQTLEDENRRIAAQRREEDYRLQLASLGENLSDQLQEYEFGFEHVSDLMEQYYGPGGVSDAVLEAFHARELARITVTEEAMKRMAVSMPEVSLGGTIGGHPATGYGIGLQHGGVVHGPASFHVEAGMTEAVIPLSGGTVTHNHNFGRLGVDVRGLESANPADVNAIASAMARELTAQIRALRRS